MAKEIQFILYNLPDSSGTVQAYVENETLWLTQKAMAQLFDVGVPAINKHITNIFQEGELLPEATISKMEIVQQEGNRQVKREQTFYSLDAIISVGYRVNSQKATKFRQWATRVLNEFIRKGFVLDDDRLKQGNFPNRGSISSAQAKAKAEAEYDLFNPTQQIDSDFDKEIRGLACY